MKPLDPLKEERIINAVFAIAGKKGLAGINIANISEQAGVGAGSLYTYFKSKEELIQAAYLAVEHKVTQKMYEGFDIDMPIKKSLKKIYINTLNYRLKHYDETVFIDQYIGSGYVQLNFSRQVKEFEQQNAPLYELLKRGQKENVFIKDLEHFTIISFINGSIRSCSNGIKQKLISHNKEVINHCFQLVWKGITR